MTTLRGTPDRALHGILPCPMWLPKMVPHLSQREQSLHSCPSTPKISSSYCSVLRFANGEERRFDSGKSPVDEYIHGYLNRPCTVGGSFTERYVPNWASYRYTDSSMSFMPAL